MAVGSGFDPDRAVALRANGKLVASGYLIAQATVLSGEHPTNADGLTAVHRSSGKTWPVVARAPFADHDMALLTIDGEDLPELIPTTLGSVAGVDALPFAAYGWPLWAAEHGETGWVDGGRLVRGDFEPTDTSPDGENLVLRPSRTGTVRREGSDWAGMSGAAVFCFDHLVGVFRRHANPQLVGSVEARSVSSAMRDPAFVEAMSAVGVSYDEHWLHRSPANRPTSVQVEAPTRLRLLERSRFFVLAPGFEQIRWRWTDEDGAGRSVRVRDAVAEVEVAITEPNPADERTLLVEGVGAGPGSELRRTIAIVPATDGDLVSVFRCLFWAVGWARGGGAATRIIRVADAVDSGVALLVEVLSSAAQSDADEDLLRQLVAGLRAVSQVSRSNASTARRQLTDRHVKPPEDVKDDEKYAYHRARGVELDLAERFGPGFDEWERDRQNRWLATCFGLDDMDAWRSYLDPGVQTMIDSEPRITADIFDLLVAQDSVNVVDQDFTTATPAFQGAFLDLVNATITEGWTRWQEGFTLVPTAIGRLRMAAELKALRAD